MLKGKNVASVDDVVGSEEEEAAGVNYVGGNQWSNQKWQNNGYVAGGNSGYNKGQQQGQPRQSNALEDKIDMLLDSHAKLIGDFNQKLDTQYVSLKAEIDQVKTHMKKLDIQVAQTAEAVKRQTGVLPGRTDVNPREHCNAVTTRGSKQGDQNSRNNPETQDLVADEEKIDEEIICDDPAQVSIDTNTSVGRQKTILGDSEISGKILVDRSDRQGQNAKVSIDTKAPVDRQECSSSRVKPNRNANANQPELKAWKPSLPYPRAPKRDKKEVEEARYKEIMEALEVRIPFFEACNLAPLLKKYVKRMVNNSMSLEEGALMITETCSNIILARMPKKLKDPGAFVLSCTINTLVFRRSLCDLGSSVNVMPLSVAKRLGYSEFFETPLILVLADRSTRKPKGILENVPIKIGNCWIPVDFIVLDYEAHEPKDPIILGRPFLATAGALIDCREGTITLRIDDETMEFKTTKTEERPTIDGQTFVIEGLVEEAKFENCPGEEYDLSCLVKGICDQGVDTQMKVKEEFEMPSAEPVTAAKQKPPDIIRRSSKPRYKRSKPHSSSADRSCNPPRRAHPVAATIPVYLGRPHAQNAYTPPWMRRLSKGPRPP